MADYKWNSVQDFANSVREKYPVYKDWSDADLTRAMFEKFPSYIPQVKTFETSYKTNQPGDISQPSSLEKLGNKVQGRLKNPLTEISSGALKAQEAAVARGDVPAARLHSGVATASRLTNELVTDPTNLALGAISTIPAARLAMAPVMGGLGLHGMIKSGTNIGEIGQQSLYSLGLSDTPSENATPEAAQKYLQGAAMLSGAVAGTGEKAATEPTAKVLDKMSKAFKSTGKLKTVAGIAGGLSTAAVTEQTGLGHPFIGYLVGREAGKAAYSGVDNVLEAAPKALRSHAFEAYQDFMNKDLLAKGGKGGTGGAASPGPGAVSPSNSPSAPTGGAATGVRNVGAPIAALPAAPGDLSGKVSLKAGDRIPAELGQFKTRVNAENISIQKKYSEIFGEHETNKLIDYLKKNDVSDPNEISLHLREDIENHLLDQIANKHGQEFANKVVRSINDRDFEGTMAILERYSSSGPLLKPGDEISLEGDEPLAEGQHSLQNEINEHFYNLRDKLYDRMGQEQVDSLMDDYIRKGIPRHERLVLMQDLINQLDEPKIPAFDKKKWANALGKVRNLLNTTPNSKPIKLPDIGSGYNEQQYLDAFEALTKMLPKMLGQEGEVMSNTLSKAVAEGNMPAQEALIHATAWINEVQRKAYQARSKTPPENTDSPGRVQSEFTPEGNIRLGGANERGWKIMGGSLYKDRSPKTVVKELLQNAFDAVRGADNGIVHVDMNFKYPEIEQKDPTFKKAGIKEFDYDNGRPVLTVSDTGKGMTHEQVGTVLTNIFESGKGADTSASGGFGVAKAAIFNIPEHVRVETTTRLTKGRYQTTTFEGTFDQLISEKGVKPTVKTKLDPFNKTRTGTTIEATLPKGSTFYDTEQFVEDTMNKSLNPPGQLTSRKYNGNIKSADASNRPTELMHETDIGGTNIKIYKSKEQDSGLFSGYGLNVEINNKGIYQFTTQVPIPGELSGIPRRIAVDINTTHPEESTDYPFSASREALKDSINKKVNEVINEEIIKPAYERTNNLVDQVYNSLPKMTDNTVVYDAGGRLTPEEMQDIQNNPVVRELANHLQNMGSDLLSTLSTSGEILAVHSGRNPFGRKIDRWGFVLSDAVHGVNISNKGQTSQTVLINPFSSKQMTPSGVASMMFHTLKHEINHEAISGHNASFTTSLAHIDENVPIDKTIDFLTKLKETLSAPDGKLHPDYLKARQIYSNSRMRQSTGKDIFAKDIDKEGRGY